MKKTAINGEKSAGYSTHVNAEKEFKIEFETQILLRDLNLKNIVVTYI